MDLQKIDLAIAKEEKSAKDEIIRNTVPEGLEEIVKAAKDNLSHLHDRLSGMEVQNDN